MPEPVDEEVDLAFPEAHFGWQVGKKVLQDLGEVSLVSRKPRWQFDVPGR